VDRRRVTKRLRRDMESTPVLVDSRLTELTTQLPPEEFPDRLSAVCTTL
jgi:hypothetical protein